MLDLKILIVEDEVLIAEDTADTLRTFGLAQIELAHDKSGALEQIASFLPDIVLLDIRMEGENTGLQIGEILREKEIPFIYITAHSDKEITRRALQTSPAGYITKPIKQLDLFAAIHLIERNNLRANEKFIVLKDGYIDVKVPINDILYVQTDNNYIHIYTAAKKHTVRNSLEWFIDNTPSELFYRTHRSYVINISKVTKNTSKSVFLNEIEVPISRNNKTKVVQYLFNK
jgi:DNA-binding LytR/AlgR family response regulator